MTRPEGKHLLTAANPGMLSQSKEIRKTGRKAEKGGDKEEREKEERNKEGRYKDREE